MPEVEGNLRKAQKSWARIASILGHEGARPKILGMFCKAVVQAVLLFGLVMWVTTPCMGSDIGSFQHRVARSIIGRQPTRKVDGRWDYPPLETAMYEAGFEEIGARVLKRQNMVAQYIATRPILDLCKETMKRSGAWFARRLWDKEGLDLAGERVAALEAAYG